MSLRGDQEHIPARPGGAIRLSLCSVFLLLVSVYLSSGQIGEQTEILEARGVLSLDKVPVGSEFGIAIIVDIAPPWHINAHKPVQDIYVPTELTLAPTEGVSFGDVLYPKPVLKSLSFSPEKMALYQGRLLLGLSAKLDDSILPGEKSIQAILYYQACDDEMCLIPTEVEIDIPLRVAHHHESINRIHSPIFTTLGLDSSSAPRTGIEGGTIGNLLRQRGLLVTFFVVFLGGLALNLTPCVYPLIPITVGYFGGQSHGSTRKTFFLALTYVLGMAVTYSALGVIAATTGSLLGATLQNPLALLFVALVLVLLSLSMFGLYTIRVPHFLTRLSGGGKEGVLGAFFMGLTVGFVAAPCVGPFVLGLLTFVGERASPLFGFFLFFTLAVGLGLPFLVLGTLSGSIRRLPRSGAWLVWVERAFGFVLLAMAVYFLRPLLSRRFYWIILSLVTLSAGLYLGWLQLHERRRGPRRAPVQTRGFQAVRKGAGILGLLTSAWLLLAPGHVFFVHGPANQGINWQPYEERLLKSARSDGKPVIIDFYAEWCLPCKELEKSTFRTPDIAEKAEGFMTLKVDLTRDTSSPAKSLREMYGIRGVPTVIFLDRQGNEIEELRFVGFLGAEEFLRKMDMALTHD